MSTNHCRGFVTRRRPAFTLVELLVAVAMIVVLLAIAIPAMKAVSENRHVGEASRLVSATIMQVQARAADTGLPQGIWIERATREFDGGDLDDTLANYGVRIYFAETPPPYTGDIQNAKAAMVAEGIARFNDSEAAMWPFLVKVGDQIQFNNSGPLYTIASEKGDIPRDTTVDPLPSVQQTFRIRFTTSGAKFPAFSFDPLIEATFKIIRQPLRSSIDPVEMPKRTAIDLDSSGIGAFGTDFQPYVLPQPPAPPYSLDDLVNLSLPIYDPALDLNSNDLHLDPDPNLVRVDDDSPVVIMFNPSGRVDRVYRGVPNPSRPSTSSPDLGENDFVLTGGPVIGTIHLLIGQDDELKHGNNLYNGDNVWISIGHLTGSVSSSPIIPAQTGLTLAEGFESYEDLPAPPDLAEAQRRILVSRGITRESQLMGGS